MSYYCLMSVFFRIALVTKSANEEK